MNTLLASLLQGGLAANIHAFQNALFGALFQARLCVVLVHHGEVIEHVFLVFNHALQAVLNDHSQLMGKGGVIADTVWNGRRQNVAVTIFVLQTLAIQCRAAGSATQQETTRLHIARSPGQIAHTLEAKHGVVNVERNHHAVVRGIRCGRCNPGTECACFVNALFQNLASLVFAVVHHLVFVDRLVQLAL